MREKEGFPAGETVRAKALRREGVLHRRMRVREARGMWRGQGGHEAPQPGSYLPSLPSIPTPA